MNLCFAYWVQHLDTATKQNKGSMSVWRVTREHTTREQPMDTGPYITVANWHPDSQ